MIDFDVQKALHGI